MTAKITDIWAYLAFPVFFFDFAVHSLVVKQGTKNFINIGSSAFMCWAIFGNRLSIYVSQNTIFVDKSQFRWAGWCTCLFGWGFMLAMTTSKWKKHTWWFWIGASIFTLVIRFFLLIWNICPPSFQAWQCQWHCSVSLRWDNGRITVTWRGGRTQNGVGSIFVKCDLSLHGMPCSLCSMEHLDCLLSRR